MDISLNYGPESGGVLSFFPSYVGSGPGSTIHQKKYQEFQAPQKIFEFLVKMSPKYSKIL